MNRKIIMKERRKALSVTIETLDKIYETQTADSSTVGLCANIINSLVASTNKLDDAFWDRERWISELTFKYFKLEGRHGAYPVEGNQWDYKHDYDKYNPQTENGQTRLRLAKGLANYLREIKWGTW